MTEVILNPNALEAAGKAYATFADHYSAEGLKRAIRAYVGSDTAGLPSDHAGLVVRLKRGAQGSGVGPIVCAEAIAALSRAAEPVAATITFSRSLERPVVNEPEIVPHQCERYPTHTCTRCQPGKPLCLSPEDAAIYHGDIDGDSE